MKDHSAWPFANSRLAALALLSCFPAAFAAELVHADEIVRDQVVAATPKDRVRFDFETGDLQGWKVVEGWFEHPVSDRAVFHNVYPEIPDNRYNKQGQFYLSTVEQKVDPSNDQMIGVIESPVFVLDEPAMSFLVGGGQAENVYVALCTLDGKEILKTRGRQTEIMQRVEWSAPQLVGQQVFLRIVDANMDGWGHVTFDDFTAAGRIDGRTTVERFARRKPILGVVGLVFSPDQAVGLRSAILDLMTTFGDRYPRGPEFLARLEQTERRWRDSTNLDALAEFVELQREALIANPLVSGQPILYIVRPQYRSSYHAIDTLFHTDEANTRDFEGGGAMKLIDFGDGGRTWTVLDVPEGIARDPEVHFTAKKIVFALRRHAGENWHIWEIDADGTGLRQLTQRARRVRLRPAVSAGRHDPVLLHARAEIQSVQPGHRGQPLPHGERRSQHPPAGPQQSLQQSGFVAGRWPDSLRALGVRGPQLRRRARPVDDDAGWRQSRDLLGQQHRRTGRRLHPSADSGHRTGRLYLRAAPRPPLGRDGRHRSYTGRGRSLRRRSHVAGRGRQPCADRGRIRLRSCAGNQAQVCRSLSAQFQVLPLLAHDGARCGNGHLPGGCVWQRSPAARGGPRLLRSDAAAAASTSAGDSARGATSRARRAISTCRTFTRARTCRAFRAAR